MQKKLAIIAGVAALGVAAVAVHANEPGIPRGQRLFNWMDADKNGKISLNEIKPKAEKRFLKLDGNSDGNVTSAEIDSWLNQQIERRKQRIMGRMDANNDSSISKEEVDRFIDAMFNEADSDKDGGVTLDEARAFKMAKMTKLMQDMKEN